MYNPEKLTTQDTQDEDKQNNMCWTPLIYETNIQATGNKDELNIVFIWKD